MKKIIAVIIGFLVVIMLAIQFLPNTVSVKKAYHDQYEEYVETTLCGFYGERYGAFEIYYGGSEVDEVEYFYKETYPMYVERDFRGIVDYIIEKNVVITEDHLFEVNQQN